MISFAAMLTKDSTPYNLNKNLPPTSSLISNFTISYDSNATNNSPNINNTNQIKKKKRERRREAMEDIVDTCASNTVADAANVSTQLDKNNNLEQANTTKIVSDNNATNKITFIKFLKENIIETFKLTMEVNNITLINKIDSKIETIFK